MKEVGRNLMDSLGLSQGQVTYREAELRRHFPESRVEGYEDLITGTCLPPPSAVGQT